MSARVPRESFWQEPKKDTWMFFCPLCRAERRLGFRPRPGGWKHGAQIAITAAVFTLATWSWFTWKGIVAFVPFWMVFEAVYRARTRGALTCPYCGFDPYLYLIDVKRARAEVQDHWRRKFQEKGIPFPGDPVPEQTAVSEPPAETAQAAEAKEELPN